MPLPPDRRAALITATAGLVALIGLALWLVPWQPVPGGAPPAADPNDYFTQAQLDRANGYSWWARGWSWSGLAVQLAAFGWLAWSRRARTWWSKVPGRRRWLRVGLTVMAVSILVRLVTLPFSVALWVHARNNGLTDQAVTAFAFDFIKSEAIALVPTALVMIAFVAVVSRWRHWWPLIAGVLAAGLVIAGSYVYPVVVEPLTNNFEPLPAGALRTEILDLAKAEGVQLDDVLVVDASRRTNTLNAYVSGIGSTRRVVLYDNTIDDLERRQLLSVVAHELGHAKHQDVAIGTSLGAAGALLGVGLLGLVLSRRKNTRPMADTRDVALVLALAALAAFVVSPAQNAVGRRIEARADVAALEATDDGAALIGLQTELALHSLADPEPPALSQWWFGSHPTTMQRIGLAEDWSR